MQCLVGVCSVVTTSFETPGLARHNDINFKTNTKQTRSFLLHFFSLQDRRGCGVVVQDDFVLAF